MTSSSEVPLSPTPDTHGPRRHRRLVTYLLVGAASLTVSFRQACVGATKPAFPHSAR
jgi:hypothetical protein